MADKIALSWWYPKLLAAKLPMPETQIVRTDGCLFDLLDGKIPRGWTEFLALLDHAIDEVGGRPCFLRTGHLSHKHSWKKTCFVDAHSILVDHVVKLVEFSALAEKPVNEWVVRKLLPVEPICTLPAYQDMPLVQEVRAFIGGGEVKCLHPYFPPETIKQGFLPNATPENIDFLIFRHVEIDGPDIDNLMDLFMVCARVFQDEGDFSVDALKSQDGWKIIDMAPADVSFHWKECSLAPMSQQPKCCCCPICGHEFSEVKDVNICPTAHPGDGQEFARDRLISSDDDYAWVL